jgi:hypothetical protein
MASDDPNCRQRSMERRRWLARAQRILACDIVTRITCRLHPTSKLKSIHMFAIEGVPCVLGFG